MKKILILIIVNFLLVSFYSCSKSSGGAGGGGMPPPPPPDPGTTGEVTAALAFSTGTNILLNATGNNTFFNKQIDLMYHDTMLSIVGSVNSSFAQLTIVLTNINAPGTYPFITNQTAPPEEGYPQCQWMGEEPDDFYSTQQIRTNPGSITIETITSTYISGYFNAELTNWYPGRSSASSTITVSNGRFKGYYSTSSN
jgi:hypothetical protein